MGAQTIGATAAGGIGSGLEVLQLQNISKGEASQESQIRTQMSQQRAAASEQSIQRNKQLEKVLATSVAQSGARGISTASGSFKAVNEDSIQTGITADRISDFNLSAKETSLRSDINQVHLKAQAARFNSLLDFGEDIFKAGGFSV